VVIREDIEMKKIVLLLTMLIWVYASSIDDVLKKTNNDHYLNDYIQKEKVLRNKTDDISRLLLCETLLREVIIKADGDKLEEAIKISEKLSQKYVEAKLYLGVAYSLKARDFSTLLSITPLGLIRAKYTYDAIEYIDEAKKEMPTNIVVSLYKSIVYYNLPSLFDKKTDGKKELDFVLANLDNLLNNYNYSFAINTKEQIKSTLFLYKALYEIEENNIDVAKEYLAKVKELGGKNGEDSNNLLSFLDKKDEK